MKTRLLVMVGMMISTTIFAQKSNLDSRKPESRGYERMKRELELNDEQSASVKNIDSKYSKKFGEQRTKFEKARFEERETLRSLRLEREREMRKVFTPAQNNKWDDLRKAQRSKHEFGNRKFKRSEHRHRHFHNGKGDRARKDGERKHGRGELKHKEK